MWYACVYCFLPLLSLQISNSRKIQAGTEKKATRYFWFRSLLNPTIKRFSRPPCFDPSLAKTFSLTSVKTNSEHVRGAHLKKRLWSTTVLLLSLFYFFDLSYHGPHFLSFFDSAFICSDLSLTLLRFSSFLEMIPRSPVRLMKTRRKSKKKKVLSVISVARLLFFPATLNEHLAFPAGSHGSSSSLLFCSCLVSLLFCAPHLHNSRSPGKNGIKWNDVRCFRIRMR